MKTIIVPQVDRNIYWTSNYLTPNRLYSYGLQFSELMKLRPKNVLEIGIGNGLLSYMLTGAGINLTTIDFDHTLDPHILGSVTNIPLKENSYNVISCFEILEHLPFDQVAVALKEIYRVSNQYAVISVPDCGRYIKVSLHLPKLNLEWLSAFLVGLRQRKHIFDGEHYWELNTRGHSIKSFIAMLDSAGFNVVNTYRALQVPRYRFFCLEKRADIKITN